MSGADCARLALDLEPYKAAKGFVLVVQNGIIGWIYFPEKCIASIVATSPEGLEVEEGLFGCDGFGPVPAIMGSDRAPHRMLIQVADAARRIGQVALSRQ